MIKYLFIHALPLTILLHQGDTTKKYRQNPLLVNSKLPYNAPQFDKIIDFDYEVAMEEGIKREYEEIHSIADNKAIPTFQNTLIALEKRGQLLNKAYNIFNLISAANTNPYLQKLLLEETPKITAIEDAVFLNDTLYKRVSYVYAHRKDVKLDSQSEFLLGYYMQKFTLAGVALSREKKDSLKMINSEEATLGVKFSMMVLNANNAGSVLFEKSTDVSGLPPFELQSAARHADEAKKNNRWLVELQNTTQQNDLTFLTDRASRQRLFEASYNRAQKSDSNDTRKIIEKIAELRAEKGHLLGFKNYAAWQLKDQMANTPEIVDQFLKNLIGAATRKAKMEAIAIQDQINRQEHFKLQPWDWNFYADEIRKSRYNLDDNEVKPYFELNNVLKNGLFYAAGQLYDISFKQRTDIPIYNPDVLVFEAFDNHHKSIGLFYFDYYKRANKNGGAWENHFTVGNQLLNVKPVIYNVANFAKPAAGQPTLLSSAEVITMFHEFGHGLHALFSNCEYPSLSGTNVARDFLEFPSQFNERWALDDKVLKHYAFHYKTGKPMPEALIQKIKSAAVFNQGYALTEALADDAIDMTWHSLSIENKKQITDSLEKRALVEFKIPYEQIPPRYRSSYFLHIWVNGYAAGYYAYEWTDMLADDAYDWFEKHGGLTRENGERFKRLILSRGHTADYLQMFKAFYNNDPSIEPLLIDRGLTK